MISWLLALLASSQVPYELLAPVLTVTTQNCKMILIPPPRTNYSLIRLSIVQDFDYLMALFVLMDILG